MNHFPIHTDRGLVKMVILIVIALIILGYLGFNLREIINSPTVKDNFAFTTSFVVDVWNKYLKKPATYLWSDVYVRLVWEPFVEALERMKDGGPAILPGQVPKLPSSATSTSL